MPPISALQALESIAVGVLSDPGLKANISAAQIAKGAIAARLMNGVVADVIAKTGLNSDKVITTAELQILSNAIRADSALYKKFLEGHGDDEGGVATGFHHVQNDGGTLQFQGHNFVNTVADAIYHTGFTYSNGRFVNEDGDANEQVADVAGWLNYFLNGTNYVFGSEANDVLYSGNYSSIFVAAANETFEGGGGHDKIWAGDGNDTVLAGNGDDESGGGTGNDTMLGGAGSDRLWGEAGNDKQNGEAGNDQLGGGDGNDQLIGGAGDDHLSGGNGNDNLMGESGNDKLWGDAGNDNIDGGDGDDELGGGAGTNVLIGGAGNDKVWGNVGDEMLYGGKGNDILTSGSGNNLLDAGDGNDKIWASGGSDTLLGGMGDDELGGGGGNDNIDGGGGSDIIYADAGNDKVQGHDGNDRILADAGMDDVQGGTGADNIHAGEGQDRINGGSGADSIQLWDNDNARDTLVFAKADSGLLPGQIDRIEGFQSGQDKIDLIAFGKLTIAKSAFTGKGQASTYYDGHFLKIDSNGDATADTIVEFAWVNTIAASDLLIA